MDQSLSIRFFNRGPSPSVRLVFFSLFSLLLLFVDARFRYLESARSALSILTYPLQRAVAVPGAMLNQLDAYWERQSNIIHENNLIHQQHTLDAVQLQQLQVLQAENQHLRELLAAQQRTNFLTQLSEIVYVERDIFKRKLFLDKGAQANVQAGQVVMDDIGVVGQVTRVYPWLSEVTLITDKDHSVPVQVLRNGLRTVAFGSGDTGDLTLRYMPNSADIQEGDILVTSGIDGTYPPGLQVAKVGRIERDPAYPFSRIKCSTLAGVDRHRQLLILSGVQKLPERPEPEVESNVDSSKRAKKKKT